MARTHDWLTSAAWPELIKQASRQAHEGIRTAYRDFGERWEPSQDSDEMKQQVAQVFAERVSQAKLGQDVQVIYRVVGGMPSQRVEFEVNVDPVGGARVAVYDARISRTVKRASIAPEDLDVAGLFEQISAGLHSLLPASRAIFPPDASVGSITIRIGDNEETFYFVPEVEQRRAPGKGVAPSMDRALQRFWGIVTGVTEAQEGAKYE